MTTPRRLPQWPLLLLAVVVVGGLLFALLPTETPPAPRPGRVPAASPLDEPPAPPAGPDPEGESSPAAPAPPSARPVAPVMPPNTGLPNSPSRPEVSALRAAFERQSPDATAPALEAQIREIYAGVDDGDEIFGAVRCVRSVCRLELRWSRALDASYDEAMLALLGSVSRIISIEPEHDPGSPREQFPISLFIARPGHTVVEMLEEEQARRAP